MSQLKNRLQALSMLDRAFASTTDDELEAMVTALPDDHRDALDELCGARDGHFDDSASRLLAMRAHVARGRMNGGLEQLSSVLVDACLAGCIEKLGDHADNPTEEQFLEAAPGLVEAFGLPTVRMMMASAIAGEANASVMLTRLLKHDETFALPAVERTETALLPAPHADDDIKAKRKAAKERKQADARARREQQLRARGR
jgi:hypothetical protein